MITLIATLSTIKISFSFAGFYMQQFKQARFRQARFRQNIFRQLVAFLLVFGIMFQPSAFAKQFTSNNSTTLLEVYTSQGCSSCPPAEKWLSRFVDSPDLWNKIIPINLHVDYWDYLGWDDPFAFKEFSQRQRRFNQLGLTSNVATPGFVVNGRGWNGWFYRQRVPLSQLESDTLNVNLENDELTINYDSLPKNTLYANIAVLGFGIETPIKRGENRGKTLKHDFVVTGFKKVKMYTSDKQLIANTKLPKLRTQSAKKSAVVVWLSSKLNPSPIQVVGGWL